jgi:hypothetical protein
VFATTFNGKLIETNRNTGKIVWSQQLSAGTNAPVATDGDTWWPRRATHRAGQKPEIVAHSLSSSSSGSTATNTSTMSWRRGLPAASS